jgi:hypothetical protein
MVGHRTLNPVILVRIQVPELCRRKKYMEKYREAGEPSFETNPDYQQPIEGEIRVIDGKEFRAVKTRWTMRQYYSHDGPGWDFRKELLDNGLSLQKFGRTFSIDEAFSPSVLPNTPMFDWKPVEK